jgi:UDP-N-acetylmuramyl pentapeptide phosphotransferase/UDP-N-acetylglucosamine-1-phosphate transferase
MEGNITMIRLLGLMAAATIASAAASALIVWSQRWHGKHTLDHDLDGVQKFHTVAVPRIGGVGVFVGISLALLFVELRSRTLAVPPYAFGAFALLLASLPTFLAGIVEDLTKKVSARARLLASIASALAASLLLGATVDRLNLWGVDSLLGWAPFALLVTAIVVAGGVNAVNIIDGFNGLAGSTVVVMLSALGAVSWQVGDAFVLDMAIVGIGAALGFLLMNYPTGRLFLGDGGAYLLGFWVAEVAVLLLVRNERVNAWQVLSICAYPVIEVLYSIYRRRIVRQSSPGEPDGLHLHTLVYRRLVSRFVPRDGVQPWRRNAAVSCLIVPWVALAALLTVLGGDSVLASMTLVILQIAGYLAVYARLVRGQWARRTSVPDVPRADAVIVELREAVAKAESLTYVPLGKTHRLSKQAANSPEIASAQLGYSGDEGGARFDDKFRSVS